MIAFYHLGVKTDKDLSDICRALNSKGVVTKLELDKEGVIMHVIPNGKHMKAKVRLYDKKDGVYEYEMKLEDRESFDMMYNYMRSI